jgi:hypothetical protein
MNMNGLVIVLAMVARNTKYLGIHITSGEIDRYIKHGIDGLKYLSRKPHSIKTKVSKEIEETILDLRLKTFGTESGLD